MTPPQPPKEFDKHEDRCQRLANLLSKRPWFLGVEMGGEPIKDPLADLKPWIHVYFRDTFLALDVNEDCPTEFEGVKVYRSALITPKTNG